MAADARYNLQRQNTTGMKIPIAMATGTSIPLESWVAYGSATRGSATRRRLLGSAEVSCSSSWSSSSASSDEWSSISSNGGSCGTSTVHSNQNCHYVIYIAPNSWKTIRVHWGGVPGGRHGWVRAVVFIRSHSLELTSSQCSFLLISLTTFLKHLKTYYF